MFPCLQSAPHSVDRLRTERRLASEADPPVIKARHSHIIPHKCHAQAYSVQKKLDTHIGHKQRGLFNSNMAASMANEEARTNLQREVRLNPVVILQGFFLSIFIHIQVHA